MKEQAANHEPLSAFTRRRDIIRNQKLTMRERISFTLNNREKAPQITNWFTVSEGDVGQMKSYLDWLYLQTTSIGENSPQVSTDKQSLYIHMRIMNTYVDVLYNNQNFLSFCERSEPPLKKEFLHTLVYAHDFLRFIFNGDLPLDYLDAA